MRSLLLLMFLLLFTSCNGEPLTSLPTESKPAIESDTSADSSKQETFAVSDLPSSSASSESQCFRSEEDVETYMPATRVTENQLPKSVMLTWSNATTVLGEGMFNDKKSLGLIAQILKDGVSLADTDEQIEKRGGGTIVTAAIQDENGETETYTFLPGTPESIGSEVMVIRGETQKYYVDIAVYKQVTDLIQSPHTDK